MPNDKPKQLLIEITRHIAGPPRRSPGERIWMTAQQIKHQGLRFGKDFINVTPKPAAKPATGKAKTKVK